MPANETYLPMFNRDVVALFFVPNLSYSHVAFNTKLADTLVENGYEVTMLVIDVDPFVNGSESNRARVEKIDVGLSNGILPNTLWKNPGPYEDASPLNPKIFLKLLRVSTIFVRSCKALVQNQALFEELRQAGYDVGFVEQYDACGLGLLRYVGVKSLFWLSATGVYRLQTDAKGIHYPLSYVPGKKLIVGGVWLDTAHFSELFSSLNDRMSLLQRVENVLLAAVTEATHVLLHTAEETKLYRRTFRTSGIFESIRSLMEIGTEADGIISNTSPVLDFSAPISSEVTSVAGITVERREARLSPAWRSITDNATDGFWLVTFGAIAKTSEMPAIMKLSLLRAFEKFPQMTFIVKYEDLEETISQVRHNVYYTKWLPQIDLISHPNYFGIITHAGWSSVLESVVHARPMILMPLFADHFKNARVIESKKLGVYVDKMSVTLNTFTDAIARIVTDESYVQNCHRYSTMLLDQSKLIAPADVVAYRVKRSLKPAWKKFDRTPKEARLGIAAKFYIDHLALALIVLVVPLVMIK
ncbi:Protein UGT-59 [Aphelenchoides avenae]|nr:Protein UGT-59 [Aphelenchus avenae]